MRRLAPLLVLAALTATALPAMAHEHVCLRGTTVGHAPHGGSCDPADDLHFIVGWRSEPPFNGLKNGLDLGVEWPGNKTFVANITTLQAQYEFGGKTFPVELRPQFNRAGWYTADITPTRAGEYTVRVWGTVAGKAVNFSISPERVGTMRDIEFPEPSKDPAELEARIATLEGKVRELEAKAAMSRNGVVPEPPAPRPAPGFEAFAVLAGLAGVALLARRVRHR